MCTILEPVSLAKGIIYGANGGVAGSGIFLYHKIISNYTNKSKSSVAAIDGKDISLASFTYNSHLLYLYSTISIKKEDKLISARCLKKEAPAP